MVTNPQTPDQTNRRRVLITGATGNIGIVLSEAFQDDYDVVMHGRTPRTERQERELRQADLGSVEEMSSLMEGVDSVVHLAGASSPESSWEDVLEANIIGTRTVLEAARLAGVRRVVHASSNHAMGGYDRDGQWPVYPHQTPRADSFYGVSKAFGEILGRFYHDEYGIDFIALRIGWMSDDPSAVEDDILHAMWLSEDDAVQVVRRAIEAQVRHGVYYAISDNPNRRWSMTNTMLELGYRPQDSWGDGQGQQEQVVEGGEPAPAQWPEGS
ncbi:NAD-dependent epimerase/dehydratase family protein [Luteococcus sp.]|uniref:NAD-dependent epimerase/dehydratase family protein n=1 Tax=Luteococcus sp. TaxID=1969402 RepID=UPI0037354331